MISTDVPPTPPHTSPHKNRKQYYQMIRAWGDWQLFQELLATMDSIAKKHKVGGGWGSGRTNGPSPDVGWSTVPLLCVRTDKPL